MRKKTILTILIVVGLALIVVGASALAFPNWLNGAPGGLLTLLGAAFVGVAVIGGQLKNWRDFLFSKDEEKPTPAIAPNPVSPTPTSSLNIGGSVTQTGDTNVIATTIETGQIGGTRIEHVDHLVINEPSRVYEQIQPKEIDSDTLAAAHARLAELPLDGIPPISTLPRGSRMPLTPNDYFVGREDDLRALASALKAGQTAAVVAATGMGGIGKTQLAVEFAHRYGRFFAGGVFWVSLANPDAVENEIVQCALEGGPEMPPGAAALPAPDMVRAVLSAWKSDLPRLLVFDNCEDPGLLAQWRPPTGGCRVLVTSRKSAWPDGMGVQTLPLDTLPRTKSLALLRKFRPDLLEDDPNLHGVAKEVGDLPLALHLAGSFLKRYRYDISPNEYLEKLKNPAWLDPSLREEPESEYSPTDHELNVAKTFALSYERLDSKDETDSLALSLLARAAYFAPDPIPRDLLKKTIANPPDSKLPGRAFSRLVEDLGLMDMEADGDLKLHRLLASFVRSLPPPYLTPDTSTPDTSTPQSSVEQTLLDEANRLNNAGYPAPLLAWQAHLRHVTDAARTREDKTAAGLCNTLGYHLDMIADYTGARLYFEQALDIRRKVLGEAHPDTARSLNNLGMLLQAMGDYTGARLYFEQALDIRRKVLGEAHPDTANSLNNLGFLLRAMGDNAGARPYYEQALEIRRKVLGEAHPDTAGSLNNLGALLQVMGDTAGARPYYEQALAIRRKVSGEAHPDTANSLNNLGVLLRAMRDNAGARPYLEEALAIRRKVLGETHPDTAGSLNNLGELLRVLGDTAGAWPYFEQALDIYRKVLGEAHPDTATGLNNLGILAADEGNLTAAAGYVRQALAIFEKALGPNHPNTKTVRGNLEYFEGLLRGESGQ